MSQYWLRYFPPFLRRQLKGRHYLQRVIDNAGWVLGERLVRYTLGLFIGVWIARYVGPEQYGLLNYAAAYVVVLAFMSTLGLDSLAVRNLVRDPDTCEETLGTLLVMRLAGGLFLILAAVLGLLILQPDDERATALVLLIAGAQVMQAFDSIDCWFQANVISRYTVIAKLSAISTVTAVRVALILMEAPLVAFAWAVLVESSVLAAGMLIVYRLSGRHLTSLRPRWSRARRLLADGWPLILSASVAAVYARIDQVMLGQFTGFAAVGEYAISVRVIEFTQIVPTVMALSVFPALIKSRELGRDQYRARAQTFHSVMLWLGVAVAIPLSLGATPLVQTIFGSSYEGAGPVLAIMAWTPIWMFISLARQRWLFAESEERIGVVVDCTGCLLNVAANLILIPRFGALGAAVASLIAPVGATFLIAPFSKAIRESLLMYGMAVMAPGRICLRARRYL